MNERMKRLVFIKKHSPKKFDDAINSGKLKVSGRQLNFLYDTNWYKGKHKKRK